MDTWTRRSKVFVGLDLLDGHNLSICGGGDRVFIYCVNPVGNSKKRNDQHEKRECKEKDEPAKPRAIKAYKNKNKEHSDCAEQDRTPCYDRIAFLMNGHLRILWFKIR